MTIIGKNDYTFPFDTCEKPKKYLFCPTILSNHKFYFNYNYFVHVHRYVYIKHKLIYNSSII